MYIRLAHDAWNADVGLNGYTTLFPMILHFAYAPLNPIFDILMLSQTGNFNTTKSRFSTRRWSDAIYMVLALNLGVDLASNRLVRDGWMEGVESTLLVCISVDRWVMEEWSVRTLKRDHVCKREKETSFKKDSVRCGIIQLLILVL